MILNAVFSAPVIIVPQKPNSVDNASAFVFDMGKINVRSSVHRKDKSVDYKKVFDINQLYDYYEMKVEKIAVYIKDCENELIKHHKYVRDLNFQMRYYNCLEPLHPTMPINRIACILNRVDVILTDFNLSYLMGIFKTYQNEQERLNKRIEEIKYEASKKITEKKKSMKKVAPEVQEKKEQPAEEKKPEVSLDPNKKIQEIMLHFDDFSLILGKGVHSEDQCYKACEEYMDELKISRADEFAFQPSMRIGLNGINVHAYMTCVSLKLETHIFRFYIRDLQVRPYGTRLMDIVDDQFEYVCCNPEVESLKEHREGDNYAAFESNYKFFLQAEQGQLFKEATNQVDLECEMVYNPSKVLVNVAVAEIITNFTHHCLNPPLYLMARMRAELPAAAPTSEAAAQVVKSTVTEPAKELSSMSLTATVQGLYLIIPSNVTSAPKC